MRNRLNSSNTNDVIVGRVRGGWGIHGEVKVESFSDAQNRFSNGKRLFVEGRLAVIQSSRIANKVLIIKLDLLNSRSEAQKHNGCLLTIPETEVPPPISEGEYYHYQILDMLVKTVSGEELGTVYEIIQTGANDVYVIRKPGRKKDILLPARKKVVLEVDVETKTMMVNERGFA